MKPTTAHEDFVRGIWKENPVFVQLLGLCPTLAVTNTLINGVSMAIATFFVLVGSSFLVATFRKIIPNEIRISAYIIIIATFVTAVDYTLAALFPGVHKALGAFIALIVVNCIILARQEAFAAKNTVPRAVLDAVGTGVGFIITMILMSGLRELLGNGTLLGFPVLGRHWEPWVFMVLPPGGFFTLGCWLLLFSWWKKRREPKVKPRFRPHEVVVRKGVPA
jgi:electron transport complex protein RnfE